MSYTLRYHPAVRDDDLPKISAEARRRIGRLIQARLGTDPARFGAPLTGSLRGYWKLRVGDYRVVFKVAGRDVWILAVVHRRDVYERASRLLR
ncbi:MAG: type II toxin-antitoxin system RelE/ParE family toxin [Chloroflexi bacterium]|nr:MAG: type II toxin-antitoxin system RelE/ParE family toxin [Chloroflexota bacterium]